MKHSKNKTGFTLIEVLFALGIVGVVLTPLLISQGSLIRWVARQSRSIQRLYAAEQFMFASFMKFEKDNSQLQATKKVEDTEITLLSTIADPSTQIQQQFRTLYRHTIRADWTNVAVPYSERLVTFLFLPEMKKE